MKYGEFSLTEPGIFGPSVVGKLAKMRKPQSFLVRPRSDGAIYAQSDKSVAVFDFRTGKGTLNTKGNTNVHLSSLMGAVEFEFPADFVAACLAACPALDSETDTGVGVILVNTIEVI